MNPDDFESSTFGSVKCDAKGVHWFDPNPLPRTLDFDYETLIALSQADAAVGRLDGITHGLANPDLLIGPYAAREAVASSRIEGTHATLTEIYESEAGKPARAYAGDVQAIGAYSRALDLGMSAVAGDGLRLETLQEVHRALLGGAKEKKPGQWRDDYVWVGAATKGPETATFVPPHADRLRELLSDWSQWHADPPRMPVLIRIALLHYQFLTIHPFVDGNGRVGRMLIQMVLEEEGSLSRPLLYASEYFAKNRREYYERLQAVRQHGEVQQWLQYFLTAVRVQANDGVQRARSLYSLQDEYNNLLSGTRSRAREVVDLLFKNPVVSARRLQHELGVSNQGALNLLRALQERGIIAEFEVAGRGGTRYWWALRILDLFDDELIVEQPDVSGEALSGSRPGD